MIHRVIIIAACVFGVVSSATAGDFAFGGFLGASGDISIPAAGVTNVLPGFASIDIEINGNGSGYLEFAITPGVATPSAFLNLDNLTGATITGFDVRLGSLETETFVAGNGPVFSVFPSTLIDAGDADGIAIAPFHGQITGSSIASGGFDTLSMNLELPETGLLAIEITAIPEPSSSIVLLATLAALSVRRVRQPKRYTVRVG